MAPCGSPHPPSLTLPSPSIFFRSGRTQLCLELYLFPGPLCPSRAPECPSEDHPLAPPPLSHQPAQPGLRPPLQSGLRRREEAPVPAPLPSRAFPAAPPALPSLFLFPIATEAAWAPALPVPAPRRPLHSHFRSPGAGAPEARPGPAVPAPGRVHQVLSQPLGSATTGQDVQASTSLPGLHPSARLAG